MLNRWAILQHTLSKDSLQGLHFDLLLEDGKFCRTWRLVSFPVLDGPKTEAIPLAPHKLYWLEIKESAVSGDRGWAKRIDGGHFVGCLPCNMDECISIEIFSDSLHGRLELKNNFCQILCSS